MTKIGIKRDRWVLMGLRKGKSNSSLISNDHTLKIIFYQVYPGTSKTVLIYLSILAIKAVSREEVMVKVNMKTLKVYLNRYPSTLYKELKK